MDQIVNVRRVPDDAAGKKLESGKGGFGCALSELFYDSCRTIVRTFYAEERRPCLKGTKIHTKIRELLKHCDLTIAMSEPYYNGTLRYIGVCRVIEQYLHSLVALLIYKESSFE